jgi:biotin carboxylase
MGIQLVAEAAQNTDGDPFGNKAKAKTLAKAAGVPTVPGSTGPNQARISCTSPTKSSAASNWCAAIMILPASVSR